MVPNAWLTKKRCFFGHLNLIITFAMHSLSMLESFISVKCCRSIGDRNCHSLDSRVEPSSCFLEKVHQVKVKYGSNQLANWGKRWIGLHQFFVYCQHMIVPIYKKKLEDYWFQCFSNFTLTRHDGPCCFNENLNWFNPMSCLKIAVLQQCIIHIHPCFSLVALSIAFFPWKPNCNHCNQTERMHFTMPLPNAC